MTTKRKFQAWALEIYGTRLVPRYPARDRSIAGVYYFERASLPDYLDGNRISLFATREKARQAARRMTYVKFRVVRVSVEAKVL